MTGVTEKLFMCQMFMCLFRPLNIGPSSRNLSAFFFAHKQLALYASSCQAVKDRMLLVHRVSRVQAPDRLLQRACSARCCVIIRKGPLSGAKSLHSPEGPARHLDASRQKLTPHCLAAIFDSQLPSLKLPLKMPPKLPLPLNRGHFLLFQNCPRGEGNCAAIERQKLSRGNFCLAASRCLSGPSGRAFCTSGTEFRPEFWETNFGHPNSGPEFLGPIF